MLNHDTEAPQGRDDVISPEELEHVVTNNTTPVIHLNPAQQYEVFDRLCGPLQRKDKHETRGFAFKQCVLPLPPPPLLLILLERCRRLAPTAGARLGEGHGASAWPPVPVPIALRTH